MAAINTTLTITRSLIENNSTRRDGGGVFVYASPSLIQNSTIRTNHASRYGGGIYYEYISQAINGTKNWLQSNTASSNGGGVYSYVRGTFNQGCVLGNGVTAFVSDTGLGIDVRNTWWGAANGPSGAGSGSGDSVSTFATFVPYRTTNPGDCGIPIPPPSPVCEGSIIGSSNVNMRSQPGEGFSIVNMLSSGTKAVVSGFNNPQPAYRWYMLGLGWVRGDLVTLDASNPMCANLRLLDTMGTPVPPTATSSPFPTPNPSATAPPTQVRVVPPESQTLHNNARWVGLPMPFDILPVSETALNGVKGYGPNRFSYTDAQENGPDGGIYRRTHGYHTGIDLFGDLTADGLNYQSLTVYSLCEVVVLRGRLPGVSNGGSTTEFSGFGLTVRCFMDDPIGGDVDGDGYRNLSNITITYNHLEDPASPGSPVNPAEIQPGMIVTKGKALGKTASYYYCNKLDNQGGDCVRSNHGFTCVDTVEQNECRLSNNHLHIEVFLARGFRDGFESGGDGQDAIRINPLLMFNTAKVEKLRSLTLYYYPIKSRKNNLTDYYEYPPSDLNDDKDASGRTDKDYGILNGLSVWTPAGETPFEEEVGQRFWTRIGSIFSPGIQNLGTNFPEWTPSSFPSVTILLDNLFYDIFEDPNNHFYTIGRPYGIFSGPYCSNYPVSGPRPSTCGNGAIINDDSGLDIRFKGVR